MLGSLKRIVRSPVWRAYVRVSEKTQLIQRLIAAPYLNRPLATWPPRVGQILDINVPRGVSPLPSPLPYGAANINNLIALLERTRNVEGDVAECGVFRGASLVALALHATQQGIHKVFHGFDSFEGFAPTIANDLKLGGAPLSVKLPGGMNETSYDLVAAKVKALKLRNVQLYKGFFENTLSHCPAHSFSFVHLDCDAYDAYVECLAYFYPRLSCGGIILVDEYNDPAWPGCNKALDEFLATRPERLQVIAEDNYQKYYIVKQ
jgi:O-methyltransferase